MTHPRTPRQAPGEALVALTVMVPPAVKQGLREAAHDAQRSVSQVARMALEAFLATTNPCR